MSDFEAEAVRYFKEVVGPGRLQRVDGVNCFSNLSGYWFWEFRLNRMVSKGILISRPVGSIWRSCNGMLAYGIAEQEGE